jgi:hypothetical protein
MTDSTAIQQIADQDYCAILRPGDDDYGHSVFDVELPQYYREGYFSADTLFHPELPGGRYGVAGDPVPYTVHGDSFLTSLLLGCFLLAVYSIANARSFITRQLRTLFYVHREGTTEFTETAVELRFQIFLVVLSCILLSLLSYFYTIHYISETFSLQSDYQLIGIYFAIFVAYFLLKALLYTIVNNVFFDGKRNIQWLKSFLFISSVEGVLSFPAVVIREYLDISIENVVIYFVILFSIVKILTFYKAYTIFFRTNVVKLQIFLYFCTLEIIPVLSLCGALVMVANSLKINF